MTQSRKSITLLKLTVSSLVISTALVGCKPAALAERPRTPASAADFGQRLAAKLSAQASQAIATGDFGQAVTLAEGLVAAAPDDAGYRTLLGQSYLRAGRFLAADQAFADVIRLMPDNDKARVAQSVARIARGDRDGALAVLSEVRNAPVDDYGLALALAGEPQKALAVLEPAARGMRGTSRTRQNLALAYALAGQWDKARVVAAQDVSPADVDRRMEDWARLASPDARAMQVANLLGTRPVLTDPGQPQMLALVKPAIAAPVEVATPAPQPQPAAPAPAATSLAAVPVQIASVSQPEAPAAVPVISGPVAIVTPPAPAIAQSVAAPVPIAIAPSVAARDPRPLAEKLATVTRVTFEPARVKPVQARQRDGWVVQLGAYKSARRAEAGWVHLSDNFKRLTQYAPAHSLYTVTATGAVYHRLSVAGFDTRGSASSMCHAIRVQGGSCFVRRQLNETPLQMVSRERPRLAGL